MGFAPQGCGADLRRAGQCLGGLYGDAELRRRGGPDGPLVAGGALFWNPVRTEDLATSFRAAQLGARYWFCETQIGPLCGCAASHVNYLLGRRTRRYDGRAWGAGLSCGYSWMLSKRWSVAVEGGLGLFHTKDTRRDPTVSDWDDEYIYHSRRWTLAPSRLELSFAYLF